MSTVFWLVEKGQVCVTKRHRRFSELLDLVEHGFAVTTPLPEEEETTNRHPHHVFERTGRAWDEYEASRKSA